MRRELDEDFLEVITCQMLEQAAFLFARPAELAAPGGDVVEARMGFTGPEQGEFRLVTTQALAREIAANMLGVEPGGSEAQEGADGAVGELLNILAGALAVELFGTRELCKLAAPEVTRASAPPVREKTMATELLVDDVHPLEVSVLVRGA